MTTQFAEIRGLELARTGNWNGREITDADLDGAVAAWQETAEVEPVGWCMDHNEEGESMGLLSRVWTEIRDGAKALVGDVAHIPESVIDAIRERRILGRSIAIVRNRKFGDKTYPAMLRHVSWLGVQPQGVKGMPALATYLSERAEDTTEFLYLETPELNESVTTVTVSEDDTAEGPSAAGDPIDEARVQATPADEDGTGYIGGATPGTITDPVEETMSDIVTPVVTDTEQAPAASLADYEDTKAKLAALRDELRREKASRFAERVSAREAGWIAAGIPVPALREAGLDRLYGDHDSVVTFAEGDDRAPIDVLDAVLRQFAEAGVAKMAETVPSAKPSKSNDPIAAEFAEADSEKLGFDLETYKRARAFTAREV